MSNILPPGDSALLLRRAIEAVYDKALEVETQVGQLAATTGTGAYTYTGSTSPEGTVIAAPGSIYTQTISATQTQLWYKQTGTGPTGWSSNTTVDTLNANQLASANISNVSGARTPMPGVRVLNDNSTATALTSTTLPFVVGTDDFAVACVAELAASNLNNSYSLITVAITGTLVFAVRAPLNGVIAIDHNTGAVSLPAISTSLVGTVAAVFVERVGTTLSLWINGVLVGSVTAASFGTSLDSTAYIRFGGAFVASQRYPSVIHRGWMFDHLLTQADRDFITTRGRLPNELQWAPTANLVSPTILNGGFETAGGGGADVFANWTEFTSGTGVITRDTVDFSPNYSSTASAKLAGTDGTAITAITSGAGSTLVAGKRYRLTADHKRSIAANHIWGSAATNATLVTFPLTTSWATYTADFVAPVSELIKFSSAGTITAWADNVILQRLGAFLALDFSPGIGNQVIDLSGNGLHATMTTPFEHVVPLRTGQVRQRVSTSGSTQITAGIPTNARITSVTANANGAVTLSIGNVSLGTQIVNAQVLATGRQDVTLAGRFSTTGNLFANLSAAVQVDITIAYEIAD